MGLIDNCVVCAQALGAYDRRAKRLAKESMVEGSVRQRLDAHANDLAASRRPYPLSNSLPTFIDVERHYTRADFELDCGFEENEDFQIQLWAPLWCKIITDLYSDMGTLTDPKRNALLARVLRDEHAQNLVEGAWRLGGRDAAREVVFDTLDTFEDRTMRRVGEAVARDIEREVVKRAR